MLPVSLKYLEFGYRYNQPFLKNALPKDLKYLRFNDSFNQFFDKDVLPLQGAA